jgi:hypothetical protein
MIPGAVPSPPVPAASAPVPQVVPARDLSSGGDGVRHHSDYFFLVGVQTCSDYFMFFIFRFALL